MNQMLTEVVDRGRKLSTVDGSCRPWTEVVDRGRKLYSVGGRQKFFLGSLSEGA